ncbi:hypothetical protein ACVI1N_003299 [Sinorhizobium medicae]
MSHPQPSPQQKRMDAIRNRIALATQDWGIESDGGLLCLTAASSEGTFLIATIAADAPIGDSEMVLNAPYDLIWLLGTMTPSPAGIAPSSPSCAATHRRGTSRSRRTTPLNAQ